MRKTKPKTAYGFYCDLCEEKICKYSADFKACGGMNILRAIKVTSDDGTCSVMNHKELDVCHDCAADIAQEVIDTF